MNRVPSAVAGAVRLADWGVICARGEDAAAFLHGQLTQDIERLDAEHARLAGYCSPKGRLLASFVVVRPAADELLLACSADLLPSTLKRLSMFVLRARCKLTDATSSQEVWGLAGEAAAGWLAAAAPGAAWQRRRLGDGSVVRLPDGGQKSRFLLLQPAGATPPALPALDAQTWAWLEAQSAVARIVAATADRFVPQMLNYELVGGVDFRKGCYPGQEVVARSQYRGTIKRRAMLFDTDASAQPGDEVFHADDPAQPAGLVANVGVGPDGVTSALVEVKLAAVQSGTLHLRASDGPVLRLARLPYALPADTD
jgi:folate-binding protein YgfZ